MSTKKVKEMGCDRCDNGWLEIDDMPAPCRRCQGKKDTPIAPYVRTLADAMGLRDWVIEVQATPCDDEHLAEVNCIYGQQLAHVHLCEGWKTLDPELQRSTLVHELIHVHTSLLVQSLADMLEASSLGTKSVKLIEASTHLLEEALVDRIAVAWSQTLPLPGGGS